MAETPTVSVRLDPADVKRAERLVAALARDPAMRAARVSRSTVVRLALLRGLDALERDYGAGARRRAPK